MLRFKWRVKICQGLKLTCITLLYDLASCSCLANSCAAFWLRLWASASAFFLDLTCQIRRKFLKQEARHSRHLIPSWLSSLFLSVLFLCSHGYLNLNSVPPTCCSYPLFIFAWLFCLRASAISASSSHSSRFCRLRDATPPNKLRSAL